LLADIYVAAMTSKVRRARRLIFRHCDYVERWISLVNKYGTKMKGYCSVEMAKILLHAAPWINTSEKYYC